MNKFSCILQFRMSLEDRGGLGPMAFEDPAEAQWLANRESPEFQAYCAELYRRLEGCIVRARQFSPGEVGSSEYMREIGTYWWRKRREAHMSRYQVAEREGLDVNSIRFVETGLPDDSELTSTFFSAYARALGNPRIYEDFQGLFQLSGQGETPKK